VTVLWAMTVVLAMSAVADPAGCFAATTFQTANAATRTAATWTAAQRRCVEELLQGLTELAQGRGQASVSHSTGRSTLAGGAGVLAYGSAVPTHARGFQRPHPTWGCASLQPAPLHLTRIDLPPPAAA
jgi:hypothetical protein